MREYQFNMENIKFGKKKNNMFLLQDGENLFLSLKDSSNQEICKIKVLHISGIKKLTNFFLRGFNMPLDSSYIDNMLIPEEDLMEIERKIIITGDDSENKIKNCTSMLGKKFDGAINREDYERKMIYLDTPDKQLQNSDMIFRLTQENNDVKATIHMDNSLPGDQKHIIKFFFTDVSIPQVVYFFNESLSLTPITKVISSKRTEYKSSIGDVSIDRVKDENANYYSIELELDKFSTQNRDSQKIDEIAKQISLELGLDECNIVDLGTEAIYNKVSGKDFFEEYSLDTGMVK